MIPCIDVVGVHGMCSSEAPGGGGIKSLASHGWKPPTQEDFPRCAPRKNHGVAQ